MQTSTRLFSKETYIQRRRLLKRSVGSGLVLLAGNDESPINYQDNPYPFRQDSTFIYYCGLDRPGLNVLLDIDEGRDILFGDDGGAREQIWSGPRRSLADRAETVGLDENRPAHHLAEIIARAVAAGRVVHVLPPYRPGHVLLLARLLRTDPLQAGAMGSQALIQAVVAQRSVKTEAEIQEIEAALEVTRRMHLAAMAVARPGRSEYEVVGAMLNAAYAGGALRPAYPIIFSAHGEVLHPRSHDNRLETGQLAVNDSGAESRKYYASDITRTLPVSGTFTRQQAEIYNLVLETQQAAIARIKPGVRYLDIHLDAARRMARGLTDLGLLRGDSETLVELGVHALFFPHGLGHMMGLDVHDMENLGEDHVGYTGDLHRSRQFGLAALRLARELQPGFVVTVEPGLYFIPDLIDQWRAENRFADKINYDALEPYRGFGGVRIEDNVLVTADGCRVLGPPIPKTPEAVVEQMREQDNS